MAISYGTAMPADYGELPDYDNDEKLSYGLKYSEQFPDQPEVLYESSDDDYQPPNIGELRLIEEYRKKRSNPNTEKDSIDVNGQFFDDVFNVSRPERTIEAKKETIPLRGLISAIESHLVSSAQEINARSLRKRRSSNDTETTNATDVNKNLFEGIFEYTRPQRKADDKDITIPLGDLVKAVESTFINSAQNLNSAPKQQKRNVDSTEENPDDEIKPKEKQQKKDYHLKKLSPSERHDLDILNPITFKSHPSKLHDVHSSESDESNESHESDEDASTTASPIQSSNITVLESTNSTHIISSVDNKIGHIQHQQIAQTIFQSNLAILPTIPPHLINVPLPTEATTEPIATDALHLANSKESITSATSEQKKELKKTQKLKEKVKEVEANPVILSQGI